MDLVSEKLFALTTDGGEEYCGQIIQTSLQELEWRNYNDDLKLIYIAGNEPFTQGPIAYQTACELATQKDITINTIFCGDHEEGIRSKWEAGALAGKGTYMSINQNERTVHIDTPYDKEITRLNEKLNNTYIPFGKKGKEKLKNQKMQDTNAGRYGTSNVASRAAFKSSKKYKAEKWDLVDAYNKDKKIVNEVQEIPDSLQNISVAELEAKIQNMAEQRATIQSEMQSLDKKRRKYIEKESAKNKSKNNLEKSVMKSIEKQAKKKGYKIKN